MKIIKREKVKSLSALYESVPEWAKDENFWKAYNRFSRSDRVWVYSYSDSWRSLFVNRREVFRWDANYSS